MSQAEPDVSRIPSGVILTKKGERHCAEHAIDAAEIAAKNDRARLSIGREIEKLLRIRREADRTAARLIDLLDLHEPDPDLEPYLGFSPSGYDDDLEADDSESEFDLGWTTGINQAGRAWLGLTHDPMSWAVPDGEEEHDGREPDCEDENGHDMEDCAVEYHGGDPGVGAAP